MEARCHVSLGSVTSAAADRYAAVIFDLDGVLIDAEIWWDEVRNEFAQRHGRPWTAEDRAAVMGQNTIGWSRTMQARLRLDDLTPEGIAREVIGAMKERYRTLGAPKIEGAVETVRRLAARLPVGLASSSPLDLIVTALDKLELATVLKAVASSDEVGLGKPAPDVYLLAAKRLGVEPARCIVVEDSLNGVRAGRAAGMTVVLVPNASVPPAKGARELASLVLDRIDQLDLDRVAVAA